jgi:hypothetical protein
MDGGGNIATDPVFAVLVPGVFRLGYGSPCIDAGSNMAWMASATDVLGMPRIALGAADMGAYELPSIHYVATNGLHVAPFTNWVEAATMIVAAVNVAVTGSIVAVGGGTYMPGSDMQIAQPIIVQGVDGANATVVNGNGGAGRFLVRQAVVGGFTVTNCSAGMAGGVLLDSGVIQDCLLTGNGAGMLGGGLQINAGVAYRCRITGNIGTTGGGVLLLGGLGKLWNCVVDRNTQTGLLAGFGIASGGGVLSVGGGEIAGCTIAANTSSNGGGGIAHLTLGSFTGALSVIDSIVYDNAAGDGSSNYQHLAYNAQWQNSCTTPLLTNVVDGGGNIVADPGMADVPGGNYRIPTGSPCENTGTNLAWSPFATDLDGAPRMKGGTVDMGAYEAVEFPFVAFDATNDPLVVDAPTNMVFTGTANLQVAGDMWIANSATAQVVVFAAAQAWTSPVVAIELDTNVVRVFGTNVYGMATNDVFTVIGVPEPVIAGVVGVIGYWLVVVRRRSV